MPRARGSSGGGAPPGPLRPRYGAAWTISSAAPRRAASCAAHRTAPSPTSVPSAPTTTPRPGGSPSVVLAASSAALSVGAIGADVDTVHLREQWVVPAVERPRRGRGREDLAASCASPPTGEGPISGGGAGRGSSSPRTPECTWRPPVSIRRPVTRVLLGGALLSAGVLAVVGGLAIGGPGLVGVGLAAALAGCTAAGIAREAPGRGRGTVLEAAVWAACCTAGVVLVVTGVSTVAGGAVAAVVVLAALAVVAVRWARSQRRRTPATPEHGEGRRLRVRPPPAPPGGARRLRPVSTLSTRALGDEWVRTTAALAGRLSPTARAALVRRREEPLDELERRDPQGFAKWLAAGPASGSDPADYVRGGPAQHGPVADTDAA